MKDFLVSEEKRILRKAHRAERIKKKADRIKTILLLNEGWSYEQIAQALIEKVFPGQDTSLLL